MAAGLSEADIVEAARTDPECWHAAAMIFCARQAMSRSTFPIRPHGVFWDDLAWLIGRHAPRVAHRRSKRTEGNPHAWVSVAVRALVDAGFQETRNQEDAQYRPWSACAIVGHVLGEAERNVYDWHHAARAPAHFGWPESCWWSPADDEVDALQAGWWGWWWDETAEGDAGRSAPREDAPAEATANDGGEPFDELDGPRHPVLSRVPPDAWRDTPEARWDALWDAIPVFMWPDRTGTPKRTDWTGRLRARVSPATWEALCAHVPDALWEVIRHLLKWKRTEAWLRERVRFRGSPELRECLDRLCGGNEPPDTDKDWTSMRERVPLGYWKTLKATVPIEAWRALHAEVPSRTWERLEDLYLEPIAQAPAKKQRPAGKRLIPPATWNNVQAALRPDGKERPDKPDKYAVPIETWEAIRAVVPPAAWAAAGTRAPDAWKAAWPVELVERWKVLRWSLSPDEWEELRAVVPPATWEAVDEHLEEPRVAWGAEVEAVRERMRAVVPPEAWEKLCDGARAAHAT